MSTEIDTERFGKVSLFAGLSQLRQLASQSSPAQEDVIEKILKSLGLWNPPWKRKRRGRGTPARQLEISTEDEMFSEAPPLDGDDLHQAPPCAGWGL